MLNEIIPIKCLANIITKNHFIFLWIFSMYIYNSQTIDYIIM